MRAANPELSTLLAVEAVETAHTQEAEDALRQVLLRPFSPVIFQGPDGEVAQYSAFSADGRRLLTGFDDGSVRVWPGGSPKDPIVLKPVIPDRYDGATAAFGPAAAAGVVVTVPFLGEPRTFLEESGRAAAARIWDAETGRLRAELNHPYIRDAAMSPDGLRVVTVGDDRAVVIWDAQAGAKVLELRDHDGEVVDVDFSRDGKWFVTASRDDTVRIRSAPDGKTTATLRVSGKSFVTGAVFSPDGSRVLTLGHDDPPQLWDWRGAPGSSLASLKGRTARSYFAGFSADSSLVATAGGDAVQVWQVSTGRLLHELEHPDAVSDATFSPDGRWIVSVAIDGSATLWEASSGKRLTDLGSYDGARSTAAFAPDGVRLATGTASGQVLVYSCDVCGPAADLVRIARSRVTRTLTAEERDKYLAAPAAR